MNRESSAKNAIKADQSSFFLRSETPPSAHGVAQLSDDPKNPLKASRRHSVTRVKPPIPARTPT